MARIARTIAIGEPHHITHRGNNKQIIFNDEMDHRQYLKLVHEYTEEHHCRLWAYCLMPNHVHFLMVPEEEDSMARCFRVIASCYTKYFNKKYHRTGRIWEGRYYSCIVDKENYLWAVARYIERNPVRAGLSNTPTEYTWSSARANILGEGNRLITGGWFAPAERNCYAEFLKSDDKNQEVQVRRCTTAGRPLGTDAFIGKLEIVFGRKFRPGRPGRRAGH